MPRSQETAEFKMAEVMRVTDAALGCHIDGNQITWIPKSRVCDDSEIDADSNPGDIGTLVIPQWLAEEKGLV